MTEGESAEPAAIDPDLAEDMFGEFSNVAAQSRPVYVPTPDQIAAECLLIQAGWTEAERLSRLRGEAYSASRATNPTRNRNRPAATVAE